MGRGVVVFWEALILGLCKLLGPERGHRDPDMACGTRALIGKLRQGIFTAQHEEIEKSK